MKIFILSALFAISCALPAMAQPQEGADMFPARAKPFKSQPAYVITISTDEIKRDLQDFARRFGSRLGSESGNGSLFGASSVSPLADNWSRKIGTLLQGSTLQIESVEILPKNIGRDGLVTRARVSYHFQFPRHAISENRRLWERSHQEVLSFRFGRIAFDPDIPDDFITDYGKRTYRESQSWRIVPPRVEPPALRTDFFAEETTNFWANVAYHLAQKTVAPVSLAERSLNKLRQIGVAVQWFTQEHDERYAVAPNFMIALRPYAQNSLIFQIPDSKEFYTFNGNLLDLNANQVAAPAQTVLFYEGQNETPIFRYEGRAAIGFADGHAALVTPDEARKLIWKP